MGRGPTAPVEQQDIYHILRLLEEILKVLQVISLRTH